MSRSGYTEDCDEQWEIAMWRGTVANSLRGRRGQAALKEMLAALDAMPVKRLVREELEAPVTGMPFALRQDVCALGALGRARGMDLATLDPEDIETVASKFNVAVPMAREVVWINDEAGRWNETPEQRFDRVRKWVASAIKS